MPASIFAGQKVKTLKDALSLNGESDIISRDVNPQTSAVDAKAGSLLLNPTSGTMYRKLDAGSTTNWVEVGAGTGGKNYIKNPDFDGGATTSWSMQKVSLSSFIPTGNIGAADAGHTIATSSSSPLEGANSLLVQGASAFTAGNCLVSAAFTIDREDVAKVMGWSFAYEAITTNMDFSGTSANTWAVYIAEVTTGTPDTVVSWIQPAGVYNLVQGSGVGLASGTFQTTATESSAYRIVLVCINSEAAATTLKVDDFQLGPQKVVYGSPVTDWQDYTPTVTVGTGTVPTFSSVLGKYRRVGDTIEVEAALTWQTATTFGSLYVSLPQGTIDLGKLSQNVGVLGNCYIRDTGLINYPGVVRVLAAFTDRVEVQYFLVNTSDVGSSADPVIAGSISQAAPFTFASGDQVQLRFVYPAAGLSSTVQMSNDTDTRVVAAVANGNPTNTLSGSPTTMNCGSKVYDTHGAYNATTGAYVVPVSGYYLCSANTEIAGTEATDANITIVLYLNNSPSTVNGASRIQNSGLSTSFCYASGLIYVNAGQSLDFRVSTSIGSPFYAASTTGTSISFQRISGPATIAASETVAARYTSSAGNAVTNAVVNYIDFATKDYDTHNMVTVSTATPKNTTVTNTGWKAIIPVSGKYEINVSSLAVSGGGWVAGEQWAVGIAKNGIEMAYGTSFSQTAHSTVMSTRASDIISCLAGDRIEVVIYQDSGAAVNMDTGVFNNYVSIVRVGN